MANVRSRNSEPVAAAAEGRKMKYYIVRHSQGGCMAGDYDDSEVDMLYAFTERKDAMEAARHAAELRNKKYWGRYHPMDVKEVADGYQQCGETQNRSFKVTTVEVEGGGGADAEPPMLWAVNVERAYEPHGLESFFCGNKAGKELAVKHIKEVVRRQRSDDRDDGDIYQAVQVEPTARNVKLDVRLVTKINPDFSSYFDYMDEEELREHLEYWAPEMSYTIQLIKIPIQNGPLPESKYESPMLWSDGYPKDEAKYEIDEKCSINTAEIMLELDHFMAQKNKDE